MAIAKMICEYKQASIDRVLSDTRQQYFCSIRQLIWSFAYYHFGYSYPQIAAFSNRDHTTVITGVKRVTTFLPLYDDIQQEVETIKILLTTKQ